MTGQFIFSPTPIGGLTIIERMPRRDQRGFFSRFFCAEEIGAAGFRHPIAQINHTLTHRRGTVRGMHFQFPPHAEDKLVSCLRGEVFDVAVDLRANSPTYLRWHGEVLSDKNFRGLLIPRGFAHGFQTLVDDCELLYLHTQSYAPEAEGAVNACDPKLGIEWPLFITERSVRDSNHPALGPEFKGLMV